MSVSRDRSVVRSSVMASAKSPLFRVVAQIGKGKTTIDSRGAVDSSAAAGATTTSAAGSLSSLTSPIKRTPLRCTVRMTAAPRHCRRRPCAPR